MTSNNLADNNLVQKIIEIYTPIFESTAETLSSAYNTSVNPEIESIEKYSNIAEFFKSQNSEELIFNIEEYSNKPEKYSLTIFPVKTAINLSNLVSGKNSKAQNISDNHINYLKEAIDKIVTAYNKCIPQIDLFSKELLLGKNKEDLASVIEKINYSIIIVKCKLKINETEDYLFRVVPEDILMFDKKINEDNDKTVKGNIIDHDLTKTEKYTGAKFDEFPIGVEPPKPEGGEQPITVQPVQFPSFDNHLGMKLEGNRNFDLLLDIKLKLTVELGRTEMPIKKILELTRGSIIELDKVAGEPVELYASGKMIAKGEVVVIEDNFGLRIISIVSPDDRIKNL